MWADQTTSLNNANHAAAELAKVMNRRYYPRFHLAPTAGWMNDPNRLIYFNGQYHAFYQHHPYDENWGPMHWGHAVSDDLVNWKQLPLAIAPDQEYDIGGCFSGSAVDNNGELALIYTGHVWLNGHGDLTQIREVQCLATSKDGIHFEKKGVVLKPLDDGIMHFRDPKVWKHEGKWWMVVGQRDLNDEGQILLYRSDNLESWQLDQVLLHNVDPGVYMFECPDFFSLGDKWVLMFSPQGMKPQGYQYRNIYQSGYIVGDWQPGQPFIPVKPFQEIDHGHDFYAPQSFLAADGRRLAFAWMDMWESPMPSKDDKWMGAFSLARELIWDSDNNVRNRPIKELIALRGKENSLSKTESKIKLNSELQNTSIESTYCELDVEIDMTNCSAERFGLQLAATKDGKQATLLYIDMQSQRIVLDRSLSGRDLKGYRSVPLPKTDKIKLHIYVDASSIEVFVNEDLYSLSSRIYPLGNERIVNLFAENGSATFNEVKSWQLNSIY